jgi:hypothetical protein
MSHSTREPHQRIENLQVYVAMRLVHQNTSLIGGKIFYDGKQWDNEDYHASFPPTQLIYTETGLNNNQR